MHQGWQKPSEELREKKFFQFIDKKTQVVTIHEDKGLALYEKKNQGYLTVGMNSRKTFKDRLNLSI